MIDPVRVAVVGVGHLGRHHARVLAALPGVSLVGVVDTFGRVLLTPALGGMAIFMMMAAILAFRPKGLFPAHG